MATSNLPTFSFIFYLLFLVGSVNLLAQSAKEKNDSIVKVKSANPIIVADTSVPVLVDSSAMLHSPKRATLYSALLPGLGQAYNNKYWKIPIIYAGFAGLAYGIWWNNKYYQEYKFLYPLRVVNPNATLHGYDSRYTATAIKSRRDYMRRNRDLCIIATGLLYVLNIVDATVDGYFYEYDISNDLGMKIGPTLLPTDRYATLGLSLSFNLN